MEGKNITLLCYEKDEEICHRKFVKNICEQEVLSNEFRLNVNIIYIIICYQDIYLFSRQC
jgi:hypothetical protein